MCTGRVAASHDHGRTNTTGRCACSACARLNGATTDRFAQGNRWTGAADKAHAACGRGTGQTGSANDAQEVGHLLDRLRQAKRWACDKLHNRRGVLVKEAVFVLNSLAQLLALRLEDVRLLRLQFLLGRVKRGRELAALGNDVDRQQTAKDADHDTCHDSDLVRRTELWMDLHHALRNHSVTAHGQCHACLAVHHDEQHRCDSTDRPDSHQSAAEIYAQGTERKSYRLAVVQRGVRNHSRKHSSDSDVEHRADNQ